MRTYEDSVGNTIKMHDEYYLVQFVVDNLHWKDHDELRDVWLELEMLELKVPIPPSAGMLIDLLSFSDEEINSSQLKEKHFELLAKHKKRYLRITDVVLGWNDCIGVFLEDINKPVDYSKYIDQN